MTDCVLFPMITGMNPLRTSYGRSYLESLTTRELTRMADREGIDVPPDFERIFIIQELLENGVEEEVQAPEEKHGKLCPVPLPKQYNITTLEVLLRDPLWVFAFWEIKGPDKERFEASPDFDGYCLMVVSLDTGVSEAAFTVRVGCEDNAWYLGFPPQGGLYKVELCLLTKEGHPEGETRVLAVSRRFFMPRLLNPPESEECLKNPLLRLSGAEYFSLLRNPGTSARL